jgi:hypothetical protein
VVKVFNSLNVNVITMFISLIRYVKQASDFAPSENPKLTDMEGSCWKSNSHDSTVITQMRAHDSGLECSRAPRGH